MNRTIALGLLLVFAGGLIGAWISRSSPMPAQAAPSRTEADEPEPADLPDAPPIFAPLPSSTADAERLLTQSNQGEALAWLTDPTANRGVAQWGKDEAIGLVNHFYSAGAVKVVVVDTELVEETEVASQFIIVLPADPAARDKIFKIDAAFEAEYSTPPTADVGQKYLHLTTD